MKMKLFTNYSQYYVKPCEGQLDMTLNIFMYNFFFQNAVNNEVTGYFH